MSLDRSPIARKIKEGTKLITGPPAGGPGRARGPPGPTGEDDEGAVRPPAGEEEVLPRVPDRDLLEQVGLGGKRREVLRHILSRFLAHLASVVLLLGAGIFSGRIFSTSPLCFSMKSSIFRWWSLVNLPISSGVLMMCGVRKISRFVFFRLTDENLKRCPRRGMSPRSGIFDSLLLTVSCIIPPRTTVSPFLTSTLVLADLFVVVGPTEEVARTDSPPLMADDSW